MGSSGSLVPVALVLFGIVALTPFLPELRRTWHRRKYAGMLQDVVNDMARIQDRIDVYPVAPQPAGAAAEPASPEDPSPERRAAAAAASRTPEPPS